MSEPFFDISVEQSVQVSLRLWLSENTDGIDDVAAGLIAWFGDSYTAHPQLDDLLRLSVHRLPDPSPLFDTVRDGIDGLRWPTALLATQARPTRGDGDCPVDLVLLTASAVGAARAPNMEVLAGGESRVVWTVGPQANEIVPQVHRDWSAGRTVADETGDAALLIRLCADLVRVVTDGSMSTGSDWVKSPAVSDVLRGTGYVVG